MKNKIYPRNLTARAQYKVVGNPATSRPESAVGNCYPGLEVDLNNLERRFFPGLVFNFIDLRDAPNPNPLRRGAKLCEIDLNDMELFPNTQLALNLFNELKGEKGSLLENEGPWYLFAIEQASKRIEMKDGEAGLYLEGHAVHRLIRSLDAGDIRIELRTRGEQEKRVYLKGFRRHYTDVETGVIGSTYREGELTQGLCSPWQSDFRDCGCFYWASNHPDVVYSDNVSEGANDIDLSLRPLDWLRKDRSSENAYAMTNTEWKVRPFQIDLVEINSRWQDLNIVLENREIQDVYKKFHQLGSTQNEDISLEALKVRIERLAKLEYSVSLMYLYAFYSVKSPEEVVCSKWHNIDKDVAYARHTLLQIAACEMQHIRWANQMLWEVSAALNIPYHPVLEHTDILPCIKGDKKITLNSLTPEILDVFVLLESPGNFLDTEYKRIMMSMKNSGLGHRLYELSLRTLYDGIDHQGKFLHLRKIFLKYQNNPEVYLRDSSSKNCHDSSYNLATNYFRSIKDELRKSYTYESEGRYQSSSVLLKKARENMSLLHEELDKIARMGLLFSFFEIE